MTDWSIRRGDVENAGRWLMAGALTELGRLFVIFVVVCSILSVGIELIGSALHLGPGDDTDAAWGQPSGLRLRRDALTGCEYLETHDGAITPRLRADGRQVCR